MIERIRNKDSEIVRWMRWTDNIIRAEGARMISEVLKINSTLIKFDLRSDRE